MISDGNRLSRVTGAMKIIWGLFLKNLLFYLKEKAKIYISMEARSKVQVFLTMQITLTTFEEKRRCSCYKKILQGDCKINKIYVLFRYLHFIGV